ncbi:MAG: hypothetical protein LBH09_00040 [Peptococcaceae bacterium]|jgi:putative iron-only hydrogenase system regulator|nr:hypothetical protein [Peptococcaceae bacterium]
MESNIAFVGIMIEDLSASMLVNSLLHDVADKVLCRTGIPYHKRNLHLISVIMDAPDNEINALAVRLSCLPGVSVKTMLQNAVKIALDKTSYAAGEKITITLTGATPINNVILICKKGAPSSEVDNVWGSDVPTSNPFSTNAPSTAGDYEMRLHSVRYGVAESNLMTTAAFTVV